MTLATQSLDTEYKVTNIAESVQDGLYALGVFPGVTLKIMHKSWGGHTLQVRLGYFSNISIRKNEAEFIEVVKKY